MKSSFSRSIELQRFYKGDQIKHFGLNKFWIAVVKKGTSTEGFKFGSSAFTLLYMRRVEEVDSSI